MNACTMQFATQRDLTRHMQSVHDSRELTGSATICVCPHARCDYSANGRKDNLRRHIKAKHRLETGFGYLGQPRN
jgi:uncharacterized Zn-finger protein